MSDKNLRLQVVLNAVDKLTRPFKMAQASTRTLAQDVKNSRDALKRLDEAGQKLTSFNALLTWPARVRYPSDGQH